MALPLIPILGPLLIKGAAQLLPSSLADIWAPRIAAAVSIILAALLLGGVVWLIRNDGWNDGRAALRAEQAEALAKAEREQRDRERDAEDDRRRDLASGTATDAVKQKEKTDATKDLPDSAPSARQHARVCVELRQAAKAAGRPEPAC